MLFGAEKEFLKRMNELSKELGLNNTNFQNVMAFIIQIHYSTANDLYILTYRLMKDFPEYYHYFAILEYTHNGITQKNRNSLLDIKFSDPSIIVDGLKTGHVDDSKYSLAFSAIKDSNFRITGVIME